MHPRPAWPALLGGVVALVGAAAFYLWALGGPVPPQAAPADWHLVDTRGHAVAARDLRGRYLLLYFGYTACPDLCPQTLGTMIAAQHLLGGLGAQIQPVFISIDPARDTPAVLGQYVGAFGKGLIGLTGSVGQVDAVQNVYGVVATHAGSAIDHSSVLVLIGPDGRFVTALPATIAAAELARRLAQALA